MPDQPNENSDFHKSDLHSGHAGELNTWESQPMQPLAGDSLQSYGEWPEQPGRGKISGRTITTLATDNGVLVLAQVYVKSITPVS